MRSRWAVVALAVVAMLALPAQARPIPGGLDAMRPSRPVLDLPACDGPSQEISLDPARHTQDLALDPARGLPDGWKPTDLVDLPVLGRSSDGAVRAVVLDDLEAMHEAASADDAPFDVVSAYRSQAHQERVYDRAEVLGADGLPTLVAPPGHSEHQLGTAIDVVDPSHVALTTEFATTPAGRWIARHAAEYGFVVSYPEGAAVRSCYPWEPWHLRWIGRERARHVVRSGLTLREWLMLDNGIATVIAPASAVGSGIGGVPDPEVSLPTPGSDG